MGGAGAAAAACRHAGWRVPGTLPVGFLGLAAAVLAVPALRAALAGRVGGSSSSSSSDAGGAAWARSARRARLAAGARGLAGAAALRFGAALRLGAALLRDTGSSSLLEAPSGSQESDMAAESASEHPHYHQEMAGNRFGRQVAPGHDPLAARSKPATDDRCAAPTLERGGWQQQGGSPAAGGQCCSTHRSGCRRRSQQPAAAWQLWHATTRHRHAHCPPPPITASDPCRAQGKGYLLTRPSDALARCLTACLRSQRTGTASRAAAHQPKQALAGTCLLEPACQSNVPAE